MIEHWRRVAASVIEDQDVDIYTNEGGRETDHVSMQEKPKNLLFDTLISRCNQLFANNRRSKEKAEKDSEGKTGEGKKDAEVFDEENEEGSEDCELLKAMACREAGMASKKKGTGPSKEHMAQGLALRNSARDGPPGRGATQSLPVAQPAGGRGKGSSSNSKSRYSAAAAAAAANNRSRGEDCRFRRESETSDGEVSSLSLATATGEDEEEEEELSDEPDAWDRDRKATLLASGKAGRGTRSGKGGGKRTRSVPPLSSTISGSAGLQDRLSSVIDLVSQKMTPPAVPTGGGGEQGGASSSTGSDAWWRPTAPARDASGCRRASSLRRVRWIRR